MSLIRSAAIVSVTVLGVVLVALAGETYRRWDGPGRTSLTAFVALLALAGLGTVPVAETAGVGAVTFWLTTCTQVGTIAWVAFALRYTGRSVLVSPRAARVATGAYVGFIALPFALGWATSASEVAGFVAVSGYMTGLVATLLGVALVLETTYRHGYLSGWAGLAISFVAVDPWFLTMVGFATQERVPATALYTLNAGGFLAYVVLLAYVLYWSDAPEVTAAAQAVGRRALLSETTDLVVVADEDGRIVEQNETARTTLPADVSGGESLSVLLGDGIETLRERDSTELSTVDGVAQYDVQTVALTDRRGEALGWLVSLRDITDRRRREQVLDVLNRVLRHNIRNELDVTKAQTTFVADSLEDPELSNHLSTALSSVDAVLELARQARVTQQALETEGSERVSFAVHDRVAGLAEDVRADVVGEVTVTGGNPVIETDGDLFDLAVRNVLENALEHSTATNPEATVTLAAEGDGVRVRVDDDGEGIPDSERAVIESGRETDIDHTTGIGLWVVEWATTACGGTVTFGAGPNGGRVDLWFPDGG